MIDVSRHIFPVETLKKQIDIAAGMKMNRLHLHLTDAGGWRLQLERWPRLTAQTAWRTESDWQKWWIDGDRSYQPEGSHQGYGGYYTSQEMRQLVAYAADRGIEVIPEIEMPGHSEEVLAAYPELRCLSADSTSDSSMKSGDLCLGNPQTYHFLESVLDEVMSIFPSEYIHIGGDEAGMQAWNNCPRCQQKLEELSRNSKTQELPFSRTQNLKNSKTNDPKNLQTHLIRHIALYLRSHGRRMLGWDEIIDDSIPNAMVTVWRDAAYGRTAIAKGMEVVMTPCANCYINNFYCKLRLEW